MLRKDPTDPVNRLIQLLLRLTLRLTKTYLGPNATKISHIPEIIRAPTLFLNPHVFLLGILFKNCAFKVKGINEDLPATDLPEVAGVRFTLPKDSPRPAATPRRSSRYSKARLELQAVKKRVRNSTREHVQGLGFAKHPANARPAPPAKNGLLRRSWPPSSVTLRRSVEARLLSLPPELHWDYLREQMRQFVMMTVGGEIHIRCFVCRGHEALQEIKRHVDDVHGIKTEEMDIWYEDGSWYRGYLV
ncbi:hypothetical protein GQX73_g8748 [Xylaria multiplex]|uniref:Uncharacterized protein n=1 Tax=Xylaria multiplex TaxID=323545 RepID=A0A7C8N2B5_9PEZI|nr:hypothetical protein GQX73_g8748 [Xylaria multiplex]